MKAKVLTSFSGTLVGTRGQEIDIVDEVVFKDLLQAGYIKPVKGKTEAKAEAEEKPEGKAKEAKNEGKRAKSKKSS